MRALIQRVSHAEVTVMQKSLGAINQGLLLFLGIAPDDTEDDIKWLIRKITQMKIFEDSEGRMNLNLIDIAGEVLAISQFTLHVSTKKGNRPSFHRAAPPKIAETLYLDFLKELESVMPGKVQSGEFGAEMQVSLTNDGPVTIILDSKNPE